MLVTFSQNRIPLGWNAQQPLFHKLHQHKPPQWPSRIHASLSLRLTKRSGTKFAHKLEATAGGVLTSDADDQHL